MKKLIAAGIAVVAVSMIAPAAQSEVLWPSAHSQPNAHPCDVMKDRIYKAVMVAYGSRGQKAYVDRVVALGRKVHDARTRQYTGYVIESLKSGDLDRSAFDVVLSRLGNGYC